VLFSYRIANMAEIISI